MLTKENVIKMIVKYYYILKYYLFLCSKSWIFSITTPVTWSFRKYSDMFIIKINISYMLFSGFLGKYKVQKDNMYLK